MSMTFCKSEKGSLWRQVIQRKAAFFGFTEKHLDDSILQNYLLLVFKIYLYKSRSYGFICAKSLFLEIKKINCLEKKIARSFFLVFRNSLLVYFFIKEPFVAA